MEKGRRGKIIVIILLIFVVFSQQSAHRTAVLSKELYKHIPSMPYDQSC